MLLQAQKSDCNITGGKVSFTACSVTRSYVIAATPESWNCEYDNQKVTSSPQKKKTTQNTLRTTRLLISVGSQTGKSTVQKDQFSKRNRHPISNIPQRKKTVPKGKRVNAMRATRHLMSNAAQRKKTEQKCECIESEDIVQFPAYRTDTKHWRKISEIKAPISSLNHCNFFVTEDAYLPAPASTVQQQSTRPLRFHQ